MAEVVVERGGWPVIMNNETQVRRGRADMRFPMAPPPNLHHAMVGSDEVIIITNLEWANRFAHVNAVQETCAANGKIASVEGGMGDVGPDRGGHPEGHGPRARRHGRARGQDAHARDDAARAPTSTVSIEGRPVARGHADQAPRPDDGPAAPVGRGGLRGGRGLHPRHRRGRRRHARHRPARARSRSRSAGRSRTAAASRSRAARGRAPARPSSTASRTPTSWASSPSA